MARTSSQFSSHKLVIVVFFIVCVCLANGYGTERRQHQPVKRSPRGGFMGLNLMCQAHRRNCPGGFRKRLSQSIQEQQPRAQFPMIAGELPPLSELLQARGRPVMNDIYNDDAEEKMMSRPRLSAPIRAALLELFRYQRNLFDSRR